MVEEGIIVQGGLDVVAGGLIVQRVGPDVDALTVGFVVYCSGAIMLCLHMLVQGASADVMEQLQDPFGIANWPLSEGRDGCRTPMPWVADAPHAGFSSATPWLPADAAHAPLAVDRQEGEPSSMLHTTRALIALRRQHPALRLGTLEALVAQGPLLVLRRQWGDDAVLCAFNLGPDTLQHRLDAAPAQRAEAMALHGARCAGAALHLPPGGALLLPIQP